MSATVLGVAEAHLTTEHGIRDADATDLPDIADIFNAEILCGTASWSTEPRSPSDMAAWHEARVSAGWPVIVAGSPTLGYASYAAFRPGTGYRHTVEHSVYVAQHARGHGIARALMVALIDRAHRAGLRRMVGGVSADQPASLALHRALGFVEQGRLLGIGEKHGRRLDLVFFVFDVEAVGAPGRLSAMAAEND